MLGLRLQRMRFAARSLHRAKWRPAAAPAARDFSKKLPFNIDAFEEEGELKLDDVLAVKPESDEPAWMAKLKAEEANAKKTENLRTQFDDILDRSNPPRLLHKHYMMLRGIDFAGRQERVQLATDIPNLLKLANQELRDLVAAELGLPLSGDKGSYMTRAKKAPHIARVKRLIMEAKMELELRKDRPENWKILDLIMGQYTLPPRPASITDFMDKPEDEREQEYKPDERKVVSELQQIMKELNMDESLHSVDEFMSKLPLVVGAVKKKWVQNGGQPTENFEQQLQDQFEELLSELRGVAKPKEEAFEEIDPESPATPQTRRASVGDIRAALNQQFPLPADGNQLGRELTMFPLPYVNQHGDRKKPEHDDRDLIKEVMRRNAYYEKPQATLPGQCAFCQEDPTAEGVMDIVYTNVELLHRYVTARGMITNRRQNHNCAKHQRKIRRAIKHARMIGLMSEVSNFRVPYDFNDAYTTVDHAQMFSRASMTNPTEIWNFQHHATRTMDPAESSGDEQALDDGVLFDGDMGKKLTRKSKATRSY